MPADQPSTWIGRVSESAIVGLFDASLALPIAGLDQSEDDPPCSAGDIIEVSEPGARWRLLARSGSCADRIYTILARHGINPIHSDSAYSEAKKHLIDTNRNKQGIKDLTTLPFVTVDNADSKDLDQALVVEADADDGFLIHYALADASWFVSPNSALFTEALLRGVTYYTPMFNAPMLPRDLSEDLISLNPGVNRRALVFHIRTDSCGNAIETTISRSLVRSRAKLTYAGVQSFLDHNASDQNHSFDSAEFAKSLLALRKVGQALIDQSRERDVVELDRREASITTTDPGADRFTIEIRDRLDSERYNEQLSLLCNIEGARLLQSLGKVTPDVQSVFRIHLPPVQSRLDRLADNVTELVSLHSLDKRWQWNRTDSIADYLSKVPVDTESKRIRRALERMIRMTNQASIYRETSEQHYALKVDSYARFSSPMREIVGIFTHKELCEALDFQSTPNAKADQSLQLEIIEAANAAKQKQRAIEKAFQLEAIRDYLQSDLEIPQADRPWREATVIGMSRKRVLLNIDGFALDLKLYQEDLEEHYRCTYVIDELIARPSSPAALQFVVGEGVLVQTRAWHPEKHRYLFDIKR